MITLSVGVQYLGPSRYADFWDPKKKTARDVHGKNGLIAGQDKALSAAKMHITGS